MCTCEDAGCCVLDELVCDPSVRYSDYRPNFRGLIPLVGTEGTDIAGVVDMKAKPLTFNTHAIKICFLIMVGVWPQSHSVYQNPFYSLLRTHMHFCPFQ